jgi:nicotinamide riboside kinase
VRSILAKRNFKNQESARPLMEALNGKLGSDFASSLSRTLQAAKEISESRDDASIGEQLAIINTFFVQYRMFPQFTAGQQHPIEARWTTSAISHDDKLDAVLSLHDLIAYEWPEDVQRCLQCGQWFFRRFSHQLCCNQTCTTLRYKSAEKLKEKAAYMRRLRAAEAERNARQERRRVAARRVGMKRPRVAGRQLKD